MSLFTVRQTAADCAARRGTLHLPHATVETPAFMPVGTRGTVKALTFEEVAELGFRLILGNTFHLYLRPGSGRVARAERVVAVGTTTVRALESAAAGERQGRTALFIRPGYRFRVVDVMLTNFHLPRSSLLLLLAAFCGPRWSELYSTALDEGYRFLSFGDAMLVARR